MVLQFARAMGLPCSSSAKPTPAHVIHVKSKGAADLTALPSIPPPVSTTPPNQTTSGAPSPQSLANAAPTPPHPVSSCKQGRTPSTEPQATKSPGTTTLTPFWEATSPQHTNSPKQALPSPQRRLVTKVVHADDAATPNPAKFTFF
ncbi:hypothetical protein H310_08813 [Aphanomyces invadans]|uniref:Uncharacterized protein n=1 Tax=Aphanomyces invadans TaxID=157072 RepID=A0A024TZE8_9STRA|nr:hypothetical protein H310_08813 [Aphanomyces invadans]ETV98737.1 hypothetical protein H310_08813 [Aphanomyces invadans]|eukprot:XP_008872934.1 hypothetical protein H310_08813 [Aphanomyces invadans]